MGVRLYADLPASILPALFMLSNEEFDEAQSLITRWFDAVEYDEQSAAHDAVHDHPVAGELLNWRLSGFGKWGMSYLKQVFPVDDCCGSVDRDDDPEAFDYVVNRLKAKRAYRIDWELFRQHCTTLHWS